VIESATIEPETTLIDPDGVTTIDEDTDRLPVITKFCVSAFTELAVAA
jgi:hypothetical protein